VCSSDHAPSPSQAWANLVQPMPLGRKLQLLRRNVWTRISLLSQCCGHPGEPGC
jgi:hypothetical protein